MLEVIQLIIKMNMKMIKQLTGKIWEWNYDQGYLATIKNMDKNSTIDDKREYL